LAAFRGPGAAVVEERARMNDLTMSCPTLTIGQAAARIGVGAWMIRSAIKLGHIDEPPRLGCYRVFQVDDLPRIKAALEAAGYHPDMPGKRKTRQVRRGVLVGSTQPGWAAGTEDQSKGATCSVCGGRELGPDICLACLRSGAIQVGVNP
jgi:hypothetical protein